MEFTVHSKNYSSTIFFVASLWGSIVQLTALIIERFFFWSKINNKR